VIAIYNLYFKDALPPFKPSNPQTGTLGKLEHVVFGDSKSYISAELVMAPPL
jgi:hypothetical protein